MGIKIILTESQVANLQKKVGEVEVTEMGKVNLSCTNLSFRGLINFLDEKNERKLGHNTWVIRRDEDVVAVKYHGTDIIRINREGNIRLNTGGWDTTTTKDRLNQFLRCKGMSIFQKKGKWYISSEDDTQEYVDGTEITPDGKVVVPIDPNKIQTYIDRAKSLDIDPKFRELYGISD